MVAASSASAGFWSMKAGVPDVTQQHRDLYSDTCRSPCRRLGTSNGALGKPPAIRGQSGLTGGMGAHSIVFERLRRRMREIMAVRGYGAGNRALRCDKAEAVAKAGVPVSR